MTNNPRSHTSSTVCAAINLSKLCIGAGTLALPYATFRGGLIFAPLFIAIVAVWNGVACAMIIKCKDACADFIYPPGMSSTYSKIAYAGAGWTGVFVTDFSIIVTLIGVCISYQITFAGLLHQTIGSHLSNSALTIISGFIVYPASCAKDVGILSVFSMAGLLCLVAGVMSIILYGFYEFGSQSWADPLTASTNYNNDKNLVLWPITLTDATSYVGVATFCFGLCSLAFPVEESMTHRKQFGTAVLWSLIFVWSVYFLLGDLGALLYAQDPTGIKQNILSNLPEMSTAASVVKLSMAGFCLLTFPLTCVVPAEMIERSILHLYNKATGNKPDSARPAKSLLSAAMTTQTNYQSVHTVKISDEENLLAIGNSSSGKGGSSSGGSSSGESGVSTLQTASSYQIETVTEEPSVLLRCVNRLAIVVISTVVAICIPCFGVVVSLIGCFTVTILSFILPAYLHLQLVTRPQLQLEAEQRQEMEMLISEGDAMHPRLVELSTVKTRTTKEIKVQSDGTLDVTETVDRGRARTMSNSVLPALQMDGYRSILHISNSSQYYVDIALVAVGVLLCIVATTMTSLDAWSKLQAGALC